MASALRPAVLRVSPMDVAHAYERLRSMWQEIATMPRSLERSLRELRLQHPVAIPINMEVRFVVDGHPVYDDDESRARLGTEFEPLLRAFCVRNGVLSHAPGTNDEVIDEIVAQLELERCNEWVLIYYLKALDRLMGPKIDTMACDAVVAALGDIKKSMNVPCGFGQHDRFWAQFDSYDCRANDCCPRQARDRSRWKSDGS